MIENLSDLTNYSCTFPESNLSSEIIVDSKIREIQRKFSRENQRIIIEGPDGCGKTILLTQFVETNKSTCFSYFFTDNYWSLRPTAFLSSLCNQMTKYLNLPFSLDQNDQEIRVDIDKQNRIFENLYQKVIERIKSTNQICYFVIDGLENVFVNKFDESLNKIIQLPTNPKGLFFLGSVSSVAAKKIPFTYLSEEPHYFSIIETAKYFEEKQYSMGQIEKIQKWSGGTPGLLMLAKEMIYSSGKNIDEIINEPQNFEKLIENQWENHLSDKEGELLDILALIAYSIIPLDTETISEILNLEHKRVETFLTGTGLLKRISNNCYAFYPEAYKSFAKDKLTKIRSKTIEKLISFYKAKKTDKKSKFLLPQYLEIIENYDELKQLLTPEYLSELTSENKDISFAQKNLKESLILGRRKQDIGILKFGLASTQLNEITNQLFGFSEVLALIELKKFDQALECAYSSAITTNRIRLLSRIYCSMEKNGITVPRKAIDELMILAENINSELLDPETILNTAADLFPVLPDVATKMVDRAKSPENEQTPIELFALMTSVSSEDPGCETLLSKISDEKMRDFALTHSPWLSKLSAIEVVKKANSLKMTKAKEYLLRHWCIENPKDPELEFVLENTLDVLVEDINYHIPLRNLRQLSDVIKYCEKEKIVQMINRFEIPLFSSLQSPIQEKIRLELNFVELYFPIDRAESIARLNKIHQNICDSELDTDILCMCLSSLLVTIKRIDPENMLNLFKCVKDKLEDEFIHLMENSASQLDVTKRVLRSIALIDINLALAFADLLNTVERRDIGTQEVLSSYVRLEKNDCFEQVILKSLGRFIDKKMRDQTVKRIIEIQTTLKRELSESTIDFLLKIADTVVDPVIRSKCYSFLLTQPVSVPQLTNIYNKLLLSWEEIDIAWVRIECAFDIVSRIAERNPCQAQQLFDNAKSLNKTTSLSNQTVGILYSESIRLAARLYGKLNNISEFDQIKKEIISLSERIPSNLLRIRIFGQIALSLLRNGNKKEGDNIIQEKIIPGLQNCKDSDLRSAVISDLAITLFEYSPEEAKTWVDKLPYLIRNVTWVKVIIKLLTQSYMNDLIDEDAPIASINTQIAHQVLHIISNIERDDSIYLAVKVFSRAISEDSAKLSESQKLDLLTQLESMASKKLPDSLNIKHNGYLVLCLGEIECSRWKSAKHLKSKLAKNTGKIISMAKSIENIADRVLVLCDLGVLFQKCHVENSNKLLEDALSSVNEIKNVKDRIDRLEIIADSYGKIRNSEKTTEIIRIGEKIAESFEGIERDQILSSIIQTVYQYNKEIASEISGKIEDFSTQYNIDLTQKAFDLSKSPQKILGLPFEDRTTEILNKAAEKMNKLIASGRNTAITKETILDWLVNVRNSNYFNCDQVITWAIESLILQSSVSETNSVASDIIRSLLDCAKLMLLIGNQISNLATIPEHLKPNFQGYSVNKKYFEAGDKQKVKDYISTWIKENSKSEIIICDPYFDVNQLWILQMIPNDIIVKILCTTKGFGFQKKEKLTESPEKNDREESRRIKEKAKEDMLSSWNEISSQNPPRTMVIIQNTIFEDDELHDRFILSRDSGLSVGTSFNGFGKKDFFITILPSEDVNFVNEKYITPKIRLDEIFANVIYFELE